MKKSCPKNIEESITEALLEEKELASDIKTHISRCDECKNLENEIRLLILPEEIEIEEPSDAYFDTLWENLDKHISDSSSNDSIRFKQIFQFAAVALLFLSIGYWIGFGNSENQISQNNIMLTSDYKTFKNQSKVLLTSVINMDEYQATELLAFSIDLSKKLILDLNDLKNKYEDQPDLLEELKQLERILIVLSSLKSGSISDFKVFQYGIKNNDIIEQI